VCWGHGLEARLPLRPFLKAPKRRRGRSRRGRLLDLYRVEHLDQATRIFGVAGNPIAHSLSPLLHNTAFRRENVNAILLPLKVRALADLLTMVRELPLGGVAVTMPLKKEVAAPLGEYGPAHGPHRRLQHAAHRADGKLYGFNTDVAGVVRPLEKRLRLKGARIAVLGAGGAARRRCLALWSRRQRFFVVNRTHETAVKTGPESQGQIAQARSVCEAAF